MVPCHLPLWLSVLLMPWATACTPSDGNAPTSSTPIATVSLPPAGTASPASEPTEPPAGSSTPAAPPTATAKAPWVPGKPITARGKISNTPWQHLVGHVDGKQPEYFDLEGDAGQTIIYVAKRPTCPGTIEVQGLVYEVRGPSKHPGKPTKVDDSYGELHIDVASYRCLP
jgi:hypothetical protein